jgi:hypothetical protein
LLNSTLNHTYMLATLHTLLLFEDSNP